MQITLRPKEKIYINGAVLRFDRKVTLELLNDAVFLLEAHVMLVADANSPMRQLYFIVQTMLIGPNDTAAAQALFDSNLGRMLGVYEDRRVLEELQQTAALVANARYFEALKRLRNLFPHDDAILRRPAEIALAS